MKRFLYGIGALLLLGLVAAALVYSIPAAWLAQYLASGSRGRVQLVRVSGLWHAGSGIVVLASGSGGADAVHWEQRVHWDVTHTRWPASWALRVEWPALGPPLHVTLNAGLSRWDLDIKGWQGMFPLSALAGLGAPFNTLALDGDARISLSGLYFSSAPGAQGFQAVTAPNVNIAVGGLRSALAQGRVLGDYLLLGKVGAGGGAFELRTVQGALQLQGNGRCLIKGRWACDFQGTARAARDDDKSFSNLLGLLGKKQGQGNDTNSMTELRW